MISKCSHLENQCLQELFAYAELAEMLCIQRHKNCTLILDGCAVILLQRWDEHSVHGGDLGLFLHTICRPCLIFSILSNEITNSKTLNQNRRHYGSSIKLHSSYTRGRREKIKTITELQTYFIYIRIGSRHWGIPEIKEKKISSNN